MAVVIITDTPGGTAEQDEALMKEVGAAANPPAGAILRVAGPIPGGWRILSVWESVEAYQAFRRERLEPIWGKMGWQPIITVWPVESVLRIPQ